MTHGTLTSFGFCTVERGHASVCVYLSEFTNLCEHELRGYFFRYIKYYAFQTFMSSRILSSVKFYADSECIIYKSELLLWKPRAHLPLGSSLPT